MSLDGDVVQVRSGMTQTGSPIDQTVAISDAISAARSGQKERARQLLHEVTEQTPNHELGFLWLAALAETPATAIGHLERVLNINPNNMQALNALAVHRLHANSRPTPKDGEASWPAGALAAGPPANAMRSLPPGTNSTAVAHEQPEIALEEKEGEEDRYRDPAPPTHQDDGPQWVCALCDTSNCEGVNKCGRCGALQEMDDVFALAENRGVDETLVGKGAEKWMQRLMGGPNYEAHVNVARAFLNINRSAEALIHLERACEMQATDPQMRRALETLRSRKLVLAVDDSTTVRRLVSVSLERKGYRVVTAEDGMQALARLSEHTPDLVLLDITMPKMDGYEVCKVMKRNQTLKHVPVLMLSGKDGIFDKIKGRIAGATDYIAKPFDIAMLLHALDRHLGHSEPKS